MYPCIKAKLACKIFATICGDINILTRFYVINFFWKIHRETLVTCQLQCFRIITRLESKRNDPHPNKITAMNSLKALSNHCFHPLYSYYVQTSDQYIDKMVKFDWTSA